MKQKASVFKPSLQPEINVVNCQLIVLFFVTSILPILDLHDWSILKILENGLGFELGTARWTLGVEGQPMQCGSLTEKHN